MLAYEPPSLMSCAGRDILRFALEPDGPSDAR